MKVSAFDSNDRTDLQKFHPTGEIYTTADEVEQASLLTDEDLKASLAPALKIGNVVVGVAKFHLSGHKWHNWSFDIDVGFKVKRAVVSLALMDIHNVNLANQLKFQLGGYSLTYNGNIVRVTGRIFIGDSDGFLNGLSFNCTAI